MEGVEVESETKIQKKERGDEEVKRQEEQSLR